jgi:hypothetical protein
MINIEKVFKNPLNIKPLEEVREANKAIIKLIPFDLSKEKVYEVQLSNPFRYGDRDHLALFLLYSDSEMFITDEATVFGHLLDMYGDDFQGYPSKLFRQDILNKDYYYYFYDILMEYGICSTEEVLLYKKVDNYDSIGEFIQGIIELLTITEYIVNSN